MGALHELWERYREEVAFFVVYVREAHPEDGWVITANRDAGILLDDPTSDEERLEAATACALSLRVRIPVLIDGLDDAVCAAYGGWPDRLYLIGRDGRVAYQSDPGPAGFLPAELQSAIEAELGHD